MTEQYNYQQLIEQLLQTKQQSVKKAILKQLILKGGFTLDFFKALEQKTLQVGIDDPLVQEELAQVVEAALKMIDTDNHMKALGYRVQSLAESFQEKWTEAINTTYKATALYKQLGDLRKYGRLAANQVNYLTHALRLHEADQLAEEVAEVLQQHGISPIHCGLYTNWAIVKAYLHEPEEAVALIEQVIPYKQITDTPQKHAIFLNDVAGIFAEADRYHEAEAKLLEAQATLQMNPGYHLSVNAYQLAKLYRKMGRLSEALHQADESVRLHEKYVTHAEHRAFAVLLQAQILLELSQYDLVYRRVYLIEENFKSDLGQALSAWLMGLSLKGIGWFREAEECLRWCQERFALQFPRWRITAELALAQLYLAWGAKFGEAIYKQGHELLTTLYNNLEAHQLVWLAESRLLLAQYALAMAQIDVAQQWLDEAKTVVPEAPLLQAQYDYLWGQLAQAKGDLPTARTRYERALVAANRLRMQFQLETLQIGVMNQQLELYQSLIAICLTQNDWEAVWHYSEASRAYSLTVALGRETAVRTATSSPLMKQIYQKKATRFRLCSQLYGWLDSDEETIKHEIVSAEEEAKLRQQMHALEAEIESLYSQLLADETPENQAQAPAKLCHVDDVATSLTPDTLVLVYTRLGNEILVMGVDASGLILRQKLHANWLDIESALIQFAQRGLQDLQYDWQYKGSQFIQIHFDTVLARAQASLHQLYQALWQPLADSLATYKHIIIVADDILHYLPFQALYTGQDYVIDRHIISYAPSASMYVLCQQSAKLRQGQWGDDVVLLAYEGRDKDLMFVQSEVTQIQEIYHNAQLLINEKATITSLQALAPSARILHLATHGKMQSSSPFLSYLEVVANGDGNGRLYVYDAAQFNLHQSDLVCLSACETGQVAVRGGDFLGLQWGFFHAGTYALIANSLPVDDFFTSRLMPDFYRRYQQGQSKAVALREAQLALRRQGEQATPENDAQFQRRFLHPYFWSPFALYGFGDLV